jgi:A/G-specific adenine glycosylase
MNQEAAIKKAFTKNLLLWHASVNKRDLPWKEEQDPYKIWLSEIILQQTRAQQGLPYYLKFTVAYPTVKALAAADDNDVFRIWQGLGYYNRCKNMLATARLVTSEYSGIFPDSYEGLLTLKGIGPYTAAAIASFAFRLPHAVVDGNVYRVLSRYFGIDTPTDSKEGKLLFTALANELLDKANSAHYNQAIMDLGATVCTPKKPICSDCPLSRQCLSAGTGLASILPVKSKKIVVKTRFFAYLLMQFKDTIWIEKRGSGDIWENLHQPFLIENSEHPAATADIISMLASQTGIPPNLIVFKENTQQKLTHQIINTSFFVANLNKKPSPSRTNGIWVSINELKKLAFPKTLVSFFKNNLYF